MYGAVDKILLVKNTDIIQFNHNHDGSNPIASVQIPVDTRPVRKSPYLDPVSLHILPQVQIATKIRGTGPQD